ncbi:MAG: carotenoid 1,2-hydratase [Candidatus Dadabacteria bacterium]|nr:carotenoid 1,2-hydratase [Candidatus Dadabacteria bacterium]NIS09101.1 carotenoid 1,2-hydratase [Candidatus Dadabacteria bacterium]NIV41537.1 carotenoid 1,2-hydratase [Candidatus Dadabacteria bacterium]NIX15218.1 carotenoid 1,2-hydratase [Candidatus Dadabacteria bacterium]NIY21862.1 carotenoid 1,2-hydratase [Candidatus Dadabacteria bacterium]
MKSKSVFLIFAAVLIVIVLGLINIAEHVSKESDNKKIDISNVLSDSNEDTSFKRAYEPVKFSFPADHGSHPEFQTEWWYFTGNLADEEGNGFGYQLTFFRRALSSKPLKKDSAWRANTIYFAHFAITDVVQKKYHYFEKWSREAPELAGSETEQLHVWIDDWEVKTDQNNNYILKSQSENKEISLLLKETKNVVLNGNKGLSQKSKEPGNASYYYSLTRLDASGEITIDGKKYTVDGLSWFDHEWSTRALGEDQKGWDWFSIQLDNNTEVMVYMLRKKDGTIDPVSSGTYVAGLGKAEHLTNSDFSVDIKDYWKSLKTGTKYPSKWNMKIPKFDLSLDIQPVLNDQEFSHSFTYWEGAVKVSGGGVSGQGYVELTGY